MGRVGRAPGFEGSHIGASGVECGEPIGRFGLDSLLALDR